MSRGLLRLLRVGKVALRYRLDLLAEGTPLARRLAPLRFLALRSGDAAKLPRGERLRLALQELGPIFVKFGQILSTRRDLLPPDIADELAKLQDQVAPFDGAIAMASIEAALGRPLHEAYASFEREPLASASIAQVHAATLADGRQVVVKVLRPGVAQRIEEDLSLLRLIAGAVERHHPNADKIRPGLVVDEIAATLRAELDLQREAANASLLRRNWLGSDDLLVPEPIFTHTARTVLTQERLSGIPADDIDALDAAGIDRKALAAKGVRVFYQQVFRDNFFHADAHAGNIWVDPGRRAEPRFIALDFGIMGQLSREDQYTLAENFMAIFRRDYRRIAQLHQEAGWMPRHIRTEELEAAARAVCEPYFTRPLSEISLGEVLLKLFRTAREYELTLQPQLILLQKTLLNIEGIGRRLDPAIDIWAVAQPVLESILRERYGPKALLREFARQVPELVTHAPQMPRLVRDWFAQQNAGEHATILRSRELATLAQVAGDAPKRIVRAVLGSGLLIAAAVLFALDQTGPRWFGYPASAWIAAGGALVAFLLARASRRP